MKRKPISSGRSARLFHFGDRTSRVNISAAPMRYVDTSKLRKGDVVRGCLSRKRYRVICSNSHEVYVIHDRLRRFRANKAFWIGSHELEAI